jgi:hypothetical protein
VQKLRTTISLVLFASIGVMVSMINPYLLLTLVSVMAFVAIARQINLSKIAMMLKKYAKTVSKLRFEIRAKLHTGYGDYSASLDAEKSSQRSSGFVR